MFAATPPLPTFAPLGLLSRTGRRFSWSLSLEDDLQWALEVVSDRGTSIVWDDTFASDRPDFEVFARTVATEGMSTFLDEFPPPTLH